MLFYSLNYHLNAYPNTRRDYRININELFDKDEYFLYQNEHFKAIIRRLCNKHGHLVNRNFEIAKELLEPHKESDAWFDGEDLIP